MAPAPTPSTATALTQAMTAGILLAGGQSRRMGADKPLLRLGGESLLSRAIKNLRPQCDALLISGNGDLGRFASYGLPVVADDVRDFAGPLAGILAGLDFLSAYVPEARFAVSVATDAPFLPSDLVARFHAARQAAGAELVCARCEGRTHPVIALWPVTLRRDLRHALVDEALHKVEDVLERYRLAYADWPSDGVDPFFNINAPEDLTKAEELIAAGLARSMAR